MKEETKVEAKPEVQAEAQPPRDEYVKTLITVGVILFIAIEAFVGYLRVPAQPRKQQQAAAPQKVAEAGDDNSTLQGDLKRLTKRLERLEADNLKLHAMLPLKNEIEYHGAMIHALEMSWIDHKHFPHYQYIANLQRSLRITEFQLEMDPNNEKLKKELVERRAFLEKLKQDRELPSERPEGFKIVTVIFKNGEVVKLDVLPKKGEIVEYWREGGQYLFNEKNPEDKPFQPYWPKTPFEQ